MVGAVASSTGGGWGQVVLEMDQKGRRKRHPLDREAGRQLEAIAHIIEPLTRSLGTHCEIVPHDYRVPDRSVGRVTEWGVVSATFDIGSSVWPQRGAAQDRLNYLAKAPDGGIIKSSTTVLRDASQRAFGALCINLDVTEVRQAARILNVLVGQDVKPAPTTFADDGGDIIDGCLRSELNGRSVTALSRSDRLEIVRSLDARGVFNVKRAVEQVAAALGGLQAIAYASLRTIRDVGDVRTGGAPRGGPSGADRSR